jgi:hypothetical protein
MNETFLLMDLERTIQSGVPCFWKGNRHGYTYNMKFAGLFRKDLAEEIVKNDYDKKTVMISLALIEKILGKDFMMHES